MSVTERFAQTLRSASDRSGDQVVAGVLAVRGPETGGVGPNRMFGRRSLAKRLKVLNLIARTPTHLRLFALGGRSGLDARDEIGAWPLGAVRLEICDADRSSFYASTFSSIEYQVHVVRILADGVDLSVDVMADPEGDEIIDTLRAMQEATGGA
ncbi:MAG: hypothetical protein JWO77_2421 [Ilumatobacteraceae bacterium]|nr:hypothetical protein [Ilumatobacteraceae bacterium]